MKKVTSRRSPRLNRDLVIAAAVELVEAEGLSSLSARKLAARLGCEAMSLYNHVASMDDLYDGMVDSLLGSLLPTGADRESIELASSAYLGLAEQHPNAFVLVATRRWRTAKAAETAMALVTAFRNSGHCERKALRQARVLGAYLNGAGLALAAWMKDDTDQTQGGPESVREDLQSGLSQMIATLLEARS